MAQRGLWLLAKCVPRDSFLIGEEMKRYRTLETVRITGGLIGLDESQALPRMRCLDSVEDGVFIVMLPVEFKAGEVIFLDEPAKTMAVVPEETGDVDEDGAVVPEETGKRGGKKK
jgi:hypothetical protein